MFDPHGFTCPVPHILLLAYAGLGLKPRALCRLDEQSTKLLMSPALFVLLTSPHVAKLTSNLLQTWGWPSIPDLPLELWNSVYGTTFGTVCMYAHTSACMSRPEGDSGSLSQLLFILVSDKTQWTWSSLLSPFLQWGTTERHANTSGFYTGAEDQPQVLCLNSKSFTN